MEKAPLCVLISDVHYSIHTKHLADVAFRRAIDKAAELKIPLIDCGDLTNDKAILRAECVNMLIDTMLYAKSKDVKLYLLVGNHSLVNEKASDHSLNFLRPYATVIDTPTYLAKLNLYLIPYYSDLEPFREAVARAPEQSALIMHQGVQGAFMGDYIRDKSSTKIDLFKHHTVLSGHYHRHQTVGPVTYVGNPYSLSFGEANDGPKGFLVLNQDFTFERCLLSLRKHVIIEQRWNHPFIKPDFLNPNDLLWLKISGPSSELELLDKKVIGDTLLGHNNFKLDLILDNTDETVILLNKMTDDKLFDNLIDKMPESDEQKIYLKQLWKELLCV